MQQIHTFFRTHIPFFSDISDIYWIKVIGYLSMLALIAGVAIVAYYIVKLLALQIIRDMFKRHRSIFLRTIAKNQTLKVLPHVACALVFFIGAKYLNRAQSFYLGVFYLVNYLGLFYLMLSIATLISRLIWSCNEYYEKKFTFAHQYPVYTYLKVVLLFFWVVVVMLIIATLADTSPFTLLTGIGAVSAIFLLVFRDTLLGIVASIQVAASGIVRVGDRIALDKYGIDGNIITIDITTVKVRNADNTIATIPTYALISEVVKNWRGMEESGGRRIKRAINIDINSITLCDADLINHLVEKVPGIADYISQNQEKDIINLALYREYVLYYLKNSPLINLEFLTMVRHLDPTLNGLPLEIYTFTKATSVIDYETAQADIFEHCFAALSNFNLKINQYPSQ